MRAVAQRVFEASVLVDGETVGAIERGLLVYLGAGREDGAAEVSTMVGKIAGLRVFRDDDGKMSRSVEDIGGAVLMVSQFTLFGDVRKGRRPSFTRAAPPEPAEALYEDVVAGLRTRGLTVATGTFRAMMDVRSRVDGPITILIDTEKKF
ncbi:MAG: D-aminoacyl-tRNA deacylase [Sandaracinaceae bacterium]